MDKFKECMHHDIGIGGFDCQCCNGLTRKQHGNKDPEFHRNARARFKMDTKKEIKNGIDDYDSRYDEYWDEEHSDWIGHETRTTKRW